MYNNMLVNCSNCYTPLQIPHGATTIIRCAVCHADTRIADIRVSAPSPHNHAPQGQPPSPYGRKRALICGISYKNSKSELEGCVNDAKCMKYLLVNKFKFPQECILMLTEEEIDPYKIPTKKNIKMALAWLVQGCQAGDSLFFHFSGHGGSQRNLYGDEVDGFDETLCPLDYETNGSIVDDEINATIVRPLPQGAKLHAIIDACHSGTVLDLPFLCRMNTNGQYVWEDHRPPSGAWKGSSGGEVYSFSGCDDDQTSADTSILSKVTSTGVMTFCFIEAIERGNAATYGSILSSIRSTIRNTNKDFVSGTGSGSGGVVSSLLAMLLSIGNPGGGGLTQVPQLTACQPFDVYTRPFSM